MSSSLFSSQSAFAGAVFLPVSYTHLDVYKRQERLIIQEFQGNITKWFIPEDRKEISKIITVSHHPYWNIPFGLIRMDRDFSSYDDTRNIPSVDGSTRMSPYIRFGVFSIREIYRKVQDNSVLLS